MGNEVYVLLLFIFILVSIGMRVIKSKPKDSPSIIPTKKYYRPLIGHFNGRIQGALWSDYKFSGKYQGYKFSVFIGLDRVRNDTIFEKRSPLSIRITLNYSSDSEIRINIYNGSPGPILSMKRVQVTDPDFKALWYIYSDKPSQTETYLESNENKKAIRGLIEAGWMENKLSKITLGKRNAQIVRNYQPPYGEPGFIKETLDRLIVLAEGL